MVRRPHDHLPKLDANAQPSTVRPPTRPCTPTFHAPTRPLPAYAPRPPPILTPLTNSSPICYHSRQPPTHLLPPTSTHPPTHPHFHPHPLATHLLCHPLTCHLPPIIFWLVRKSSVSAAGLNVATQPGAQPGLTANFRLNHEARPPTAGQRLLPMMTSHCFHSWCTCSAVNVFKCKRRISGKLVMKMLRT